MSESQLSIRRRKVFERPVDKRLHLEVPIPRRVPTVHGGSFLAAVPGIVFFYVLVVLPFLGGDGKPRLENILFWPSLAACVLAIAFANKSSVDRKFFRSAPVVSLAVYLALAGASVSWALAPEISLNRYILQVLGVIIILVPYAMPETRMDVIARLHIASFLAMAINAYLILTTPGSPIGHSGYFTHKQELGTFCGGAVILIAHELLRSGWRRWLALVSLPLTIWVIFGSQSKSALAFPFLAVAFGLVTCLICRLLKTTPAYVVGAVVVAFSALSTLWRDPIGRIAYMLYGDSTITGRTYIWEFINYQVSLRSWFGGGFHSYWGIPNSPHEHAPGFIKEMISTHSGYLELKLDTGYIGYWIFLVFVYASLHYLGPLVRRNFVRGLLFVSLASYILILNLIESIWLNMSGLWVVYLIVVGESIRAARSQQAGAALLDPDRNRSRRSGVRLQKPKRGLLQQVRSR